MFHKQALPDICKQVKIEGAVGLQMETKEMCLLFFFFFFNAISVFAVLSGNSLEEPLGDLPTPFSAHTEMQRSVWHAYTQIHTLAERERETNVMLLNRGGHQTDNALYYFTVYVAFVISHQQMLHTVEVAA